MSTWAPRCTFLAGVVLCSCYTSVAQAPDPHIAEAWRIYAAALTRTCPEGHRERFSSQNLNLLADRFTDRLSAADQRSVKATIVRLCSARQSDRDCDLDGFMVAAVELGHIGRFATAVCEAPPDPIKQDPNAPPWH